MESSVFLDRGTDNRHHKTTMRLKLFQRRPKKPLLAPEHKTVHTHKIETLKAGRLASLALDFTSRLIEQLGPRLATSESAQKAAEQIEQEYQKFCDYTQSSSVAVDMDIHRLPLKVVPIIYPVILLFLFFGLPYLGLILFSLYCYYVYRVLYLYKPFSYKKQKKKQGVNVHGVLHPSEEVRQTILFTAHHDSAPLYRYNQLNRLSYAKKVALPVALFGVTGILCFLQVLVELMSRTLLMPNMPSLVLALLHLLLLSCSPFLFSLKHFYHEEASPGAGDNLASVALTVQLSRYFHWKRACGQPLKHTRLYFCSFDAEEFALQGSRAWFQEMAPSLENALVLNFDSLYYADALTFLEKDVNASVELSSLLARRCVEIARSMGYEAKSEAIPRLAGGTDAAEASRAGLQACTLTSVGWDDRSKPSVYHTKDDNVSAIEVKAIEQAISVGIRLVELSEAGQLWEEGLEEPSPEEKLEEEPKLIFSKLTNR
jgi:hypothetical protein